MAYLGAVLALRWGECAGPPSRSADFLRSRWRSLSTSQGARRAHGDGAAEVAARPVRQLGIDETTYLSAKPTHPTIYATGLVDLEAKVLIDVIEGNSAADLRRWAENADPRWLRGIDVVATDLAESFRAGLSPHLSRARRMADPFHVVRVGNRCLDKVRRQVQNETLGHRGRKDDPLYRIRKLLVSGSERLDEQGSTRMLLGPRVGDPHDEVLGAWLAKESVRDVYLTEDRRSPPHRSTRPSRAVPRTKWRRSAPSVRRSSRGEPRSSPTTRAAPPTGQPKA
jgi:hypothetical protein